MVMRRYTKNSHRYPIEIRTARAVSISLLFYFCRFKFGSMMCASSCDNNNKEAWPNYWSPIHPLFLNVFLVSCIEFIRHKSGVVGFFFFLLDTSDVFWGLILLWPADFYYDCKGHGLQGWLNFKYDKESSEEEIKKHVVWDFFCCFSPFTI